jgi:hypothetical protein
VKEFLCNVEGDSSRALRRCTELVEVMTRTNFITTYLKPRHNDYEDLEPKLDNIFVVGKDTPVQLDVILDTGFNGELSLPVEFK